MHAISPTQREALERRAKFRNDIAAKAAELEAKRQPVKKVQTKPQPKVQPLAEQTKVTTTVSPKPSAERAANAGASQLEIGLLAAIGSTQSAPEKLCPTIENIQRTIASFYNKSRMDLLYSGGKRAGAKPRQVGMYLARTLANKSMPEIARRFGGIDHTSVLYGVRKIAGLVGDTSISQPADFVAPEIDSALVEEIKALKEKFLP